MPIRNKRLNSGHHQIVRSAQQGVRATIIGIFVSAGLAAIKVISGLAGHSYALIADGVESMMDIMSALVVLGTLRISATPPNERFPYGYGKAESLGAVVVSMGLFIAAAGIAVQSVREIVGPQYLPARWTLIVLIVVVVTKELMFRFLDRTGGEIGSKALESDAWHQRSDALTSAAAFIGISIAVIGGKGYEAADDWAALFACVIIAANGVRLLRSALRDVMDASPSAEVERLIREVVLNVEGVEDVDKCMVRRSGMGLFVDLHIEVDSRIPVRDGHQIAHRTKDALLASTLSVLDVNIHVEPYPNPFK